MGTRNPEKNLEQNDFSEKFHVFLCYCNKPLPLSHGKFKLTFADGNFFVSRVITFVSSVR